MGRGGGQINVIVVLWCFRDLILFSFQELCTVQSHFSRPAESCSAQDHCHRPLFHFIPFTRSRDWEVSGKWSGVNLIMNQLLKTSLTSVYFEKKVFKSARKLLHLEVLPAERWKTSFLNFNFVSIMPLFLSFRDKLIRARNV